MDKERFLQSGLLEQYVLGLTTEEENEEVQRYADAFPEIQAEIFMLQNAVKQYAEAQIGSPKINAAGAKNSTTPSQKKNEEMPSASRGSALGLWLLAALLGLSVIFGFYYYSAAQNAEQQIAQLNNNLLAFQEDCNKDRETLLDLEQQIAFLQHNHTRPIQLRGTQLAPDSKVRIYWNEQEKVALLQVFSLPEHSKDKQYQIWADKEGKMVNLGMIDDHSSEPQIIKCLPQASSLNITLEPAGGSQEPHVEHLYAVIDLP